jgi:hypothetical protein
MYPRSRSASSAEKKKLRKAEKGLKAYGNDTGTHLVGYADNGIHGILVSKMEYNPLDDGFPDMSCLAINYADEDSEIFSSNVCFDYNLASDLDADYGFTKVYPAETAQLPVADGVLVS